LSCSRTALRLRRRARAPMTAENRRFLLSEGSSCHRASSHHPLMTSRHRSNCFPRSDVLLAHFRAFSSSRAARACTGADPDGYHGQSDGSREAAADRRAAFRCMEQAYGLPPRAGTKNENWLPLPWLALADFEAFEQVPDKASLRPKMPEQLNVPATPPRSFARRNNLRPPPYPFSSRLPSTASGRGRGGPPSASRGTRCSLPRAHDAFADMACWYRPRLRARSERPRRLFDARTARRQP